MNCSEALELISSAVDNQLEEPEKSEFNKHIEKCSNCRKKFELELSTKSFIHSVYKNYTAPEDLRNKILSEVRFCLATPKIRTPHTKKLNRHLYLLIPVLIIFAILLIIPFNKHKHQTNLPKNNLMGLIYEIFDQALMENQELYVQTTDLSNLKMTLAAQTGYDIKLPKIENCKLIGGWVSDEFGKQMIHTIYKNGDTLICCTQVNLNELLNDNKIIVDEKIKEKLKSGGKYISKDFECCSTIMWTENEILFVATAEMDTNALLAYLNK